MKLPSPMRSFGRAGTEDGQFFDVRLPAQNSTQRKWQPIPTRLHTPGLQGSRRRHEEHEHPRRPERIKGYSRAYATAFHPNLRICECQEERQRQARLEREQARRAAPPKRTLHEVIAPESKGACTRFPMGKCPMNVKGKRCIMCTAAAPSSAPQPLQRQLA